MRLHPGMAFSILIMAAAVPAGRAYGDCATWDLGDIRLMQSNDASVSVGLRREGSRFTGSAAWSGSTLDGNELVSTGDNGVVIEGAHAGNKLDFVIQWAGGSVGVYSGTIDPNGNAAGTTFDRKHPESRATWSTVKPLKCISAQTPGQIQPTPSRPVRTLGKRIPPPAQQAQAPAAPPAPPRPANGNDVCRDGFVWRAARPEDFVCVTPMSRAAVWQENGSAAQRWDQAGAHGPKTCISGYVWREAFEGDTTCVTPQRRDEVREENSLAASRRTGG